MRKLCFPCGQATCCIALSFEATINCISSDLISPHHPTGKESPTEKGSFNAKLNAKLPLLQQTVFNRLQLKLDLTFDLIKQFFTQAFNLN